MRDHRAVSRALVARYTRTPRRVRTIERVLTVVRGLRGTFGVQHHHVRPRTHLTVNVALRQNLHSIPVSVAAADRLTGELAPVVSKTIRIREAPDRPRRHPMTNVTTDVSGSAAGHLRDVTLTTTRREERVSVVSRVIPRPATAVETQAESQRRMSPFYPPQLASSAPQQVAAGPNPAELATITNHVLSAIDHRLIAHNERLGRG